MRYITKIALGAAAVTCLIATPAAAQSTSDGNRVVDLKDSTPLREYSGWLLFSRKDGPVYRLAVRHDGAVRDLPVPAQRKPFDADVGPDSNGHASAVVSLCDDSCDLFVIGFDPGDRLRRVRNANTGRDEVAPTIWRGRLAFGRRYGRDRVVPYTKLLNAPRSRPSDRLAGLPARRCGAYKPPSCRRIKNANLQQMELWGRWVAQSWTYQPDGFSGFVQDEIRLTNVRRTDTRQLAFMTTGEGGQTYHGPAFADGRVGFFRACLNDPGGCSSRNSGAIRYRISSGKYEIIGNDDQWSGWTLADGRTDYHVSSKLSCIGEPGFPPCGIYQRTGLRWKSIEAKHVDR